MFIVGYEFNLHKKITFLKITQETTLGPFRVTASNAAMAALPVCRKSLSTRFSSTYCSYNGLRANQIHRKKSGMVSFRSKMHVTLKNSRFSLHVEVLLII